jgi:nucleoside-diphosphate-sugar epimerase
MNNILILGSSGIIGKNLKLFLEKKNFNVIEFDIKNGDDFDLRTDKGKNSLKKIFSKIDYTFFLAFDVGGSKYLSNLNQTEYIDNNLNIMKNVFNIIKDKPFIFASSTMENMYNIYGTLKRLGEHYTNIYGQINVRFWNIYGNEPYSEKSHVITDFIYKASNFKKINILSTGKENRQFLHVEDCSKGLFTIMLNHNQIIKKKNIIHLTSFKWNSILEVAELISSIYKCKIEIDNKCEDNHTIMNEPDKFILQYWEPKISLEEGIKKIIDNNSFL